MTRDQIYSEIKDKLGLVPMQLQSIPDEFLEEEWNLWKAAMMQEAPIPARWKELICVGISAALGDNYGVHYHTEAAKMYGATNDDLKNVAFLAKTVAGWAAFSQAMQIDMDDFAQETRQIMEFISSKGETRKKAA